jgi:erythromycin esterase
VALGEPTHFAHQPLAFRNRLFRYLVEERGFTAIVLESGLPESRAINEFIQGGAGEVREVVQENLSWGFGRLKANEELVVWLREHNARAPSGRKVRFYGIDLSLGGAVGATPTSISVNTSFSYLARVDSTAAREFREALRPLLSASAYEPSSRLEHDTVTAALDDLIFVFERDGRTFIEATSQDEYDWAYRNAIASRQGNRFLRVRPSGVSGEAIPADGWRSMSLRDAAMAENVLWVLQREGPGGRIAVFAHNGHVMNSRLEGGIWSVFDRPLTAMGHYLRPLLGDDLIIIGSVGTVTSAEASGTSSLASVDTRLAKVGLPLFLIDLRTSRGTPAATWLAEPQTLGTNTTTHIALSPIAAFDALVFLGPLTPAQLSAMSP